MMKKELDVTRFEPLESDGDVLRGGFSDAYGGTGAFGQATPVESINISKCEVTNNCHGGICRKDGAESKSTQQGSDLCPS